MSERPLRAPVAFIIFNRPEVTARVFARIAKAKPTKLLVIADGPRSGRDGEVERCKATRAIIERVDWKCEVLTNFSDVNLGCKNRVSSGLDWVFEQVSEAIILEDDCLPHPTFFRFCEELLEQYRDDERIGMISGDNFQFGKSRTKASYYFSRYNHIWGWASWKRAWQKYDRDLNLWPDTRNNNQFCTQFDNRTERKFWSNIFDKTHRGKIDTWDYQWTHALWLNQMLTVLPDVNLVSNIGFGADATHTTKNSPIATMTAEPINFPLVHPEVISANAGADRFTFEHVIYRPVFKQLADFFIGKLKRHSAQQ